LWLEYGINQNAMQYKKQIKYNAKPLGIPIRKPVAHCAIGFIAHSLVKPATI
jgi:hypothetical protein